MILCTECYIQRENQTLMLYRNKKKNDVNEGKWIGFGGKFEKDESPEECLIREVREEVGVTLLQYELKGFLTFATTDMSEPYLIFIYIATEYEGEIATECDEGEMKWVDNDKILSLEQWEGDKIFWRWLLEDKGLFSAKFVYDQDRLIEQQVVFYGKGEAGQ